ncbi:hypothetical protein ACH5RR_017697 [Cinchona calisaya]|uniref:Uncharacterized protein n=1 Tax=Cinchona calisaya TaxID=153742 RepID=A0ABD2ZKM4_9GENT
MMAAYTSWSIPNSKYGIADFVEEKNTMNEHVAAVTCTRIQRSSGLCEYRKSCLDDLIPLNQDGFHIVEFGPPKRVFTSGLPECVIDACHYCTEEYPKLDRLAGRVVGYWALPVYQQPPRQLPVGVLEIVSSHQGGQCGFHYLPFIKVVGLETSEHTSWLQYIIPYPCKGREIDEISKVLDELRSSVRIASGQELGEKLFVEVIRVSLDDKLDSFEICHSDPSGEVMLPADCSFQQVKTYCNTNAIVARHRLQSTGFEPGSLAFCPHKEYASYQLSCSPIGKRRTPCKDKRPRTQVRIPSTAFGAGQLWPWYNNTSSSGSHKGDVSPIGKRRTPCEDKRPRTQVRIPSTTVGAGQLWPWYNNTLSSGPTRGTSQ